MIMMMMMMIMMMMIMIGVELSNTSKIWPNIIFSEFMRNKSHKISDQSVEPFQNKSKFKLLCINLMLPGSNRVKFL